MTNNPQLVFDDFEYVKLIARSLGVGRTIQLLYRNIARHRHQITSLALSRIYDANYAVNVDHASKAKEVNGFPIHNCALFAFEYLSAQERPDNKMLLDFGCGTGSLSLALASLGFTVHGIDLNQAALTLARQQAALHHLEGRARFNSDDFLALNGHYDFLILSDVIEHLPEKELRTIIRKSVAILKPGGELVIHTPNGRCAKYTYCPEQWLLFRMYYAVKHVWLIARADTASRERYLRDAFYDQTHINIMGPRQLTKLLNTNGFRVTKLDYNDNLPRWLQNCGISGSLGIIGRKKT